MRPMYLTMTLSLKRTLGLCLKLGLSLLLLAALPVAAQSTTMESLPKTSQEEISRVCLPVQFREGAGAYRNCVQAELQLRTNGGSNQMAQLSFDDKYAVQQACAKAGGQSSTAYQACVTDQISELNTISAPVFDNVSEDELYVVQQSCFDAQSKQGAANYRQCLNNEVRSLLAIPAADTGNLNMLNKNALQLRCSANASTASQYRRCIAVEFESIAGTEPTFLPLSTAIPVASKTREAPQVLVVRETVTKVAEQKTAVMALPRNINPQQEIANTTPEQPVSQISSVNTGSIGESPLDDVTSNDQNPIAEQILSAATTTSESTRVISRPDLVKALEDKASADAQGIEPEQSPPATTEPTEPARSNAAPVTKSTGLWQKFLDTLASLDGIGWLVIAGVLALPALLLGLFSLIRRVKQPVNTPADIAPLTQSVEPGIQTRMLRHERDAAEMFGEHEQPAAQPADKINSQFKNDTEAHPDHDAVTRMAMKQELPIPRQQQPNAPAAQHESIDNTASNYAWQSAFGHWLTQQPASNRMELCTEFLIYWVAYGDERYNPELKKRLFTATDLNAHDQIKRWVLKQDVFAFSDVVGWLRSNSSQTQLDQTIELVMALLVTENSVTPVQNTLLRFLSDAFDMGRVELEQRFDKAFGHPLPDMPRPDKVVWWMKQESEPMQRWNSRALAASPETEQMMARLGLSAGFNDSQVIDAFRRAARRCHPDRFTELGARERALAEQRFNKFEEARDKLLGVSV